MALISRWWHSPTVFVVRLWSSLYTMQGFLWKRCVSTDACCPPLGCQKKVKAAVGISVESTRVSASETERPGTGILISTLIDTHCLPGIIVRASHALFQGLVNYAHRTFPPRAWFCTAWELRMFTFLKDCKKKKKEKINKMSTRICYRDLCSLKNVNYYSLVCWSLLCLINTGNAITQAFIVPSL